MFSASDSLLPHIRQQFETSESDSVLIQKQRKVTKYVAFLARQYFMQLSKRAFDFVLICMETNRLS